MYKSVIFSLFLMGSLVLLVPFANTNLLSNAMAQGYNDYGDNSYYSQYPTDDKKYECRTGPFEGFFVGSVEFCKHVKFDDKDDRKDNNRTGPQGPQGIQGPIGPNGTQGPPGIVNAELCPPDTDLENVYVLNGTTAESCDLEPPVANDSNLNVTKLVTCQQVDGSGLVPSIQQISLGCDDLLSLITEDQFNITVTDTNVSPSNFNGSEIGTLVTLDAGPFTVTEEPYDSVAETVSSFEDVQTEITGPSPSFSGDCTQTGIGSFSATGEIAGGGQETCNIVNNFTITRTQPFTGSSSITTQGIAD
jgi:hypothetical protein